MDVKELNQFGQTVGRVVLELQRGLEAANARLDALGEPVVNVEAPSVTVGGAEVQIDLEAVTGAIQALTTEGVEGALDYIASAIGDIPKTEVDVSGLESAIREDKTADAVNSLTVSLAEGAFDREVVIGLVEQVSRSMIGTTEQSAKVEAATQAQFTAILEAIKADGIATRDAINALESATRASKRLILEDGKPVGVESIVN